MAENKNFFTIDGILYAKNVRKVKGVKDPTQEYEFRSIILELTSLKTFKNKEGKEVTKTFTELPEFDLASNIGFDEFEIGDKLTVKFVVEGKPYEARNGGGKKVMTKLKAIHIKFTELENGKRPARGHKEGVIYPDDNVFIPPEPDSDGDEFSDLPF